MGIGGAEGVDTVGWVAVVAACSSAAAIAPVGGWVRNKVTVPAATHPIPTAKIPWAMRRRRREVGSEESGRTGQVCEPLRRSDNLGR
jgi:hypothetical protein